MSRVSGQFLDCPIQHGKHQRRQALAEQGVELLLDLLEDALRELRFVNRGERLGLRGRGCRCGALHKPGRITQDKHLVMKGRHGIKRRRCNGRRPLDHFGQGGHADWRQGRLAQTAASCLRGV